MFFFLSKLLIELLNPFNWVVGGLLISVCIKSRKWKWMLKLGSLFLFLIFGNRGLINSIYSWIEFRPLSQDNITKSYSYGVLLGGGFARFDPAFPDRIIFGDHINRLTESMELYHSNKLKKLIISGGDGSLIAKKQVESQNIKTFLLENQ
ncbi:MAG: hypothetical protein SH818_02860, partial [Saprospiraceae bacterium]|nr:hypothetical protein [Saprospiraceae bacterium]